ncbi:MAG TPA: DNA polymerase III subunit delta [Candidatus Saccharimonadia bacterium]|nr:DNA polymerase III subunit delta [Candidatus Saccharimonadia bacterium]
MALSPAQFERHIAAGKLSPVYLIAGDEHLLVLEAADALRAAARAQGYSERDVLESGESAFEWHELAHAASSLSLFGSRRVIDLRIPTGRPGKDGSEAIQEYCASPPPDTILLITAMSWSKSHETAWVDAVHDAGTTVVAWPLKLSALPEFAQRRASSRGLALTPDAIGVRIERTEGNLLATAQEIDKLVLLAGGRALDGEALESLVADTARFDLFRLVDAAFAGDAARALHAVDLLRAEGESIPGMLSWLVTQLNAVVRMARLVERGQSVDAAMRAEHVWATRQAGFRSALQRGRAAFWEARLGDAVRVERLGKGRLPDYAAEARRPSSDLVQAIAWREFARLIGAIADARFARATTARRQASA